MPVFEYLCESCRRSTEQLVLAGDIAATPVCPSCGSHSMHRQLSTFAAGKSAGGGAAVPSGFDPATACGGGACRMPDVCGSGGGDFD